MTPEEQALGTDVPVTPESRQVSRTPHAPDMTGFEREFYTMSGADIKRRYQSDPEFRAKVDAMDGESAAPAPALTMEQYNSIPEVTRQRMLQTDPKFKADVEQLFNGVPPVAEPPAPTPESVAPSALPTPEQVAPTVTPEEAGDQEIYRQADGTWVGVVDLENGSGPQKFYGNTLKEVTKALIKAQKNASLKIRQQAIAQKEKELRHREAEVLLDESDIERVPFKQLNSRQLNADEQWEIANALGIDPTKLKTLDKYFETRLGASMNEVVDTLNNVEQQKAITRSANIGKIWVAKNERFFASNKNIETIGTFMREKGWDVTEKNLDKAFAYLDAKGFFEEAPEEVEEIVAPTPAPPAIPAASAPVATPVSPAPAQPAAVVNQPTPQVMIPAIPGTTVLGVRPGSVSTGLSARESSVRPETPVAIPVGLTAEEYRRTPMSEVKRRYATEPAYHAALDKLIAEGKI